MSIEVVTLRRILSLSMILKDEKKAVVASLSKLFPLSPGYFEENHEKPHDGLHSE
jgi:hypothetical protein